MHRLSPALLIALAFAATTPALSPPAHAQASQRAYAPEDLWTLSPADQTRVISLEYREQSSGRTIPNDQLRFYLDQVRLSRWTFSKVRQDIAKSLGNTGGGWNPGPDPGGQTIRCESNDGRSRTCSTPWQANSILKRQLSSARCTFGQSWFTSPGRVTVSNGCRAEFGPGVGGGGSGGNQVTVQCESNDGRLRTCGSNLVGRAKLQKQLSNQRCIEGTNFGLRNGSVWVDNGCRGVFLARTQLGGDGGSSDYSVTCSSTQGRYTTCAWDARRGTPRLLQQLSRDDCRAGYSWGYSGRTGLWVNHGCRARFGTR
ncbi:MAG TPA: DUF3011 domain-containing protein [Thermomonas sp.]|nr:DUF3011 domain-containing protein [Thermomonas sp.]